MLDRRTLVLNWIIVIGFAALVVWNVSHPQKHDANIYVYQFKANPK